jgi:hypothetical protein
MRLSPTLLLAAALSAAPAHAQPIKPDMTVPGFFAALEKAAKALGEGGMELNRIRCNDDGTACTAYYGAGNAVAGSAPAAGAAMETATVTQLIPGESEDFWLTSALVVELIDPDFLTIVERSQLILGAMKSPTGAPEAAFAGNVGRYTFDRTADGLSRMTATAR